MSIISEFCQWSESKGYLSHSSCVSYAQDLRKFARWMSGRCTGTRWSTIEKADIYSYIDFLRSAGIEYVSINRALSALSSLYRYFIELNMLQVSPLSEVRRLRPSYHQRESLPMSVITQVMADDSVEVECKALIALIVESGLRIGEVQALEWGDIDMECRQIKVSGKGRSFRIAFFGDTAALWLGRYMANAACGLHPFSRSRREYNWMVYHAVKPYAGAHKCSPHILRHTFATECLRAGMSMEVLSMTLGHKSVDTTKLYTHCMSEISVAQNGAFAPRL